MNALKKRPWWHAIIGSDDDFLTQGPTFIWEMYRNSKRYSDSSHESILLNHIQKNSCLVTKKGVYLCLKAYCLQNNIDLLKIIPLTFYLASSAGSKSIKDDDMETFMQFNENLTGISSSIENNSPTSSATTKEETVWIMKPASKTNRGFGIKVIRGLDNVLAIVNRASSRAASRESVSTPPDGGTDNPLTKAAKKIAFQDGWIVQLYMDRPLLISGRKFDIRCFVLVTHSAKRGMKGYFYREAYVRTSSKKYSMDKISDRETHLTNDAVQKLSKAYGKFENGNKLNFDEWQALINEEYPNAPSNVVYGSIFPEIKRMSKLSLDAAAETLCKSSINKSFELFGYDYMVDEQFNPILIEVNTNPCLEFVCPLLTTLITELIECTIRVAIDPEFPPPSTNRTKATEEGIELIESAEMKFDQIYPQ
jgi:tubulin--tyrosine ligase